jgi:hypothetical protein
VVWVKNKRGWSLHDRGDRRRRHHCATFELELKRRGLRYQAGRQVHGE